MRRLEEVAMLLIGPVIWVTCAAFIVTAAVRCRRRASARRTGRIATAVLYLLGGAAVNTALLLTGEDYATFADGSPIPFVRDTWRSLVVPHHVAWISLLIAFEVAVGVLAAVGGRATQVAYVAAIGFHIALLSFGWGFFLWSIPMVAAFTALLRAGQSRPTYRKLANGHDEPSHAATAAASGASRSARL